MTEQDVGTPYYVGCAVQGATSPPPELLENGAAFARLAEGSSRAGRVISRLRSLRFCLSTNLTAKPLGKSLITRLIQAPMASGIPTGGSRSAATAATAVTTSLEEQLVVVSC